MKMSRAALIERAKARIEALNADYEKAVAEYARRIRQAEDEYGRRYGDAWIAFAERIKARVESGYPVTIDDMPEELRSPAGEVRWYVKGTRREKAGRTGYIDKPGRPDTSGLTELIGFLEVVTEDEVTLAGLERAGLRRIGTLFSRNSCDAAR